MFRRATIFVHKKEDDIMGELRTRKRGKNWEWSFEGARIGGKRNSISKGGYRTKAEAVTAGTKAKAEYNRSGQAFSPSEVSVADYMDYWMEHYVKKNLAYNTVLDYERKIRLHIKPSLGAYRLSSLSPSTVQDWVNNLKAAGLSKSMVKNIMTCLTGAMHYAILPCKYIFFNPCEGVSIGKIQDDPKLREHREYILPSDDFWRLIDYFNPESNFYLPLMVGYFLGTRLGESYGFDLLSDVDFNAHTIRIDRQLKKEHGIWCYRQPKYDSRRTIKMGEIVEKALKEEIHRRKKIMLTYGRYYTRSYMRPDGSLLQAPADAPIACQEIMPISVRENGVILTPESFKYCARIVHYTMGLPLFHSHCLRHTHGTVLAEQGASPKTIMERLGHKDIKTTLQTYVFNTEVMQQNAADMFDTAVGLSTTLKKR